MDGQSGRTVFVRNIPFKATNEGLASVFEDDGPLKHCFVVKEKGSNKCRGFGYVTFALKEDAEKAVQGVRKLDGRKLTLSFADSKHKKSTKKKGKAAKTPEADNEVPSESEGEKTIEEEKKIELPTKKKEKKAEAPDQPKSPKQRKKCKVIVRNLSFKCDEDSLKAAFQTFGEITEVKIPKKADGRKLGYGFVQLNNIPNAAKAIKAMNGKPILGRPVAVDWAVARDKYLEAQTHKPQTTEKATPKSPPSKGGESTETTSDDDSDDDASNEEPQHDSGKASSDDSSDEDDVSSDEGSEDEDDSEDEDEDSESDDSGTNSIHSDDSDEEAEKQGSKVKKKKQSEDVDEGRTIFIRNLSYDTEEEDLEEEFSEFGEVEYCRIVCDPETEHSRGTAFVKFADASAAEACLEKANDEEGGITIDNRQLILSLAVSHQKAQELVKAKKAKEESKDKRNLWLAREGLIRPGTQAAVGLSDADIKKRQKVETMKRQKLKNPNIFVSTTRLCFHNLPTNIDDSKLRKTILQKLNDKKARIIECRVMRDMARVNAKGIGKSRGYAFVNFTDHKHALQALRVLNNNPEVFGEDKRLIVEFSLENKAALVAKQKRLERHQAKQAESEPEGEGKKQKKKKNKPSLIPGTVAPPSEKEGVKFKTTMPKHWGPKIRHKPRPQQQQKSQKTQKEALKRSAEAPKKQKPKKRRKNNKERTDNFDNLVAKYRNALGKAGAQKSGGKWFEV